MRPQLGLLLVLGACGSSGVGNIEGKYYNTSTGDFALELKGGKVVSAQGLMQGMELAYRVRGDSLVLDNPRTPDSEDLVLGIEKDGSLSAGLLGSIKRK
jgi:hypothetical protein